MADEHESVIAVRQRLASLEASLRSTELQIQTGLDALVKYHASRKDSIKKIKELQSWLDEHGG